MKKFLCYDTNDAASGKIGVNSNGVLSPNATVPSTNGAPYQQLVTDSDGNTKWEDRLAYAGSKLVAYDTQDMRVVKVSDEVPSWATIDMAMKVWLSDGRNDTLTTKHNQDLGNGSLWVSDCVIFIATDNFEFDGLVFPEKGVYFCDYPENGYYTTGIASADSDTPEITWDGSIGVIKKLDEKFLPEPLILYVH